MTPEQRRGALWIFSLFFHGEDTVADTLGPYIEAAPLEEQKEFLATQQVDEARHTILFKRFFEEVVGIGDGTVGGTLRATLPDLTWGHRKTFCHLEEMAQRLKAAPDDRTLLARAVTLYHMMIEGGLAQSGSTRSRPRSRSSTSCPASARDAQRRARRAAPHRVRRPAARRPLPRGPAGIQDAIVEEFREVLAVVVVRRRDPGLGRDVHDALGYALEDIYEEGARMQEARLRAIGLPLDDIKHFPLPLDLPPRERGERGIKLMKAGYLGAEATTSRGPTRRPRRSSSTRWRRVADRGGQGPARCCSGVRRPRAVAPRARNGATRAERGAYPTRRSACAATFEDFVTSASGRADPGRLMLTRRMTAQRRPAGAAQAAQGLRLRASCAASSSASAAADEVVGGHAVGELRRRARDAQRRPVGRAAGRRRRSRRGRRPPRRRPASA